MSEDDLREFVCEIGRRLYQKGFAAANEGNLSVRLDEREILCTPTLVSKGFMKPGDLCVVDYEGRMVRGVRQRSSEILLHLAVYKRRPDVRAVVQCHPPHATAFAVAREPIPNCILPEVELFLGEVPTVDYVTPGDQRIADAVTPFLPDCNTLILASHGVLAFGPELEQAYWNCEIIDAYCRILMLTRQVGRVNRLTAEQTAELLEIKKRWGYDDVRFRRPGRPICGDSSFGGPYTEVMRAGAVFASPAAGPGPTDELVRTITEKVLTALAQAGTPNSPPRGQPRLDAMRRPMFSFRHDKTGFFAGLTLVTICTGTLIATAVLLIVGWGMGDWGMFVWPIRWILTGWWLGCIVTVLTRVSIFYYQMKSRELAAAQQSTQTGQGDS